LLYVFIKIKVNYAINIENIIKKLKFTM